MDVGSSIRLKMFFASALLVVGSTSIVGVSVWLAEDWFGIKNSDSTRVIQVLTTLIVISVGGVVAYYKLDIFRDFQPHLTIAQDVSHRQVGNNYVHISVRASLVNTSKVKIEIRNAIFRIQQVAPLPDEEVERLYSEFNAKPSYEKYIAFPTLVEFDREWEEDEFVIEPGETGSENYEFFVKNDFDAVSLYAFFNDQTTATSPRDQKGWAAESVYDIE